MRLSAISALAGAALVLGASPALSATATGSFDVQVILTEACTVDSPSTTLLDFGSPADIASDVDAVTTIDITCTTGTDYEMTLNNGLNASRRMRLGATANYVDYELYTDNTYTTVWPSTVGAPPYSRTGTGAQENIDVYGRIPGQATPPAGTYNDTIQVTITY